MTMAHLDGIRTGRTNDVIKLLDGHFSMSLFELAYYSPDKNWFFWYPDLPEHPHDPKLDSYIASRVETYWKKHPPNIPDYKMKEYQDYITQLKDKE